MSDLAEKDRQSTEQLSAELDNLPLWTLGSSRDRLERRLIFADFQNAFSFMTHVAMKAETMNHHPEWTNVWNRVDIALTTHTAGGITTRDLALAAAIDEIASRYQLSCDINGDGECGGCQ